MNYLPMAGLYLLRSFVTANILMVICGKCINPWINKPQKATAMGMVSISQYIRDQKETLAAALKDCAGRISAAMGFNRSHLTLYSQEKFIMIRIKQIRIPELPTAEAPRRLYVYLPQDYGRSEKRYPVLYMFDGHNVFYDSHATYGKSWGMKEYLQRTRLPLIVAAVECSHDGDRRMNEYAPWDYEIPGRGRMEGLGRLTMDWMSGPLKKMIDASCRTLPDREHTLIAGSSMGGLMALYAVTAYNGIYSRAAALSPSIWAGGKALTDLFAETELTSSTQIYTDIGTAEIGPDGRGYLSDLFTAAAMLTRSGADVDVRVVPGAQHNEAAWEKRIPVFMDYLFPVSES